MQSGKAMPVPELHVTSPLSLARCSAASCHRTARRGRPVQCSSWPGMQGGARSRLAGCRRRRRSCTHRERTARRGERYYPYSRGRGEETKADWSPTDTGRRRGRRIKLQRHLPESSCATSLRYRRQHLCGSLYNANGYETSPGRGLEPTPKPMETSSGSTAAAEWRPDRHTARP